MRISPTAITATATTAGSSRSFEKIASALKLPKPHAGLPLFLMAIGTAIGTATFSSKQILNSITAHSQNFGNKVTVVLSLAICLMSLRAQAAVLSFITVMMARNTLQLL